MQAGVRIPGHVQRRQGHTLAADAVLAMARRAATRAPATRGCENHTGCLYSLSRVAGSDNLAACPNLLRVLQSSRPESLDFVETRGALRRRQ